MSDLKDRTYPRVRVSATVDTMDASTEELQLFNHIENISLGGICIMTSGEPESVGSDIEISLDLPGDQGELLLTGEVVWVSTSPKTRMGVRFLDLDIETREKLRAYLYSDQAG